jgi:hypothetical protein
VFVEVDLASCPPAIIALREIENFRDLKVVARGGELSSNEFAEAIAPVGELDAEGNAWLMVDVLKALAGQRGADPDWAASFSTMLDYAAMHGSLTQAVGSCRPTASRMPVTNRLHQRAAAPR